jgi:AcrR family transcriptional regulator
MQCQEQTDNVKRKLMVQARKPRADSTRNRQLLIDAAKAGFSEVGLNVSLEEIARRATNAH